VNIFIVREVEVGRESLGFAGRSPFRTKALKNRRFGLSRKRGPWWRSLKFGVGRQHLATNIGDGDLGVE